MIIKLILSFFVLSSLMFAFDHEYSNYTQLLNHFVKKGRVDYQALQQNKRLMKKITNEFAALSLRQYKSFNRYEKMAFLINAYNFFTLDLVVRHYPLQSIKDIKGQGLLNFLSTPWQIKFFKLLDKKRHLDWIEHDMLRAKLKEPMLHFALVCASKSCPILIDEPYKAKILNQQLKLAGIQFLNTSSKNYYNSETKTLYLSKIFDWFNEDFGDKNQLIAFVQEFMQANIAKNAKIKYLKYDWSLND